MDHDIMEKNILEKGGGMRKKRLILFLFFVTFIYCAPHFHLDFLGKEKIEEVTLIESRAKEKITVIDIEGVISSLTGKGIFSREGDLLSQVYYRLKKASEDPLVKGVILRLETPGGEVTASDILYHEILKFKEKTGRPVVGLMMGVAASGGYYIASACDAIIAHPSTITGSIGVISLFPNVQELLAKIGLRVAVIKSGEMKDSGSPFRELSEEEKKVFQGVVDKFYEDFLLAVFQNRQKFLSYEELKKIADGRIYTGEEALRLKLVDEVGYFDSALKKAISLARLREARVVAYTYYPKRKTNIYASNLKNETLWDEKKIEELLLSLSSGFYYIWIPQLPGS